MNSTSNGHREGTRKVHYTQEQLRQHASNPVAEIADHLRTCPDCYESYLIARLLIHHEATGGNAGPSPAFLRKLHASLEPREQGRLLGFPRRLAWVPAAAAAAILLVVWFFPMQPRLDGELAFAQGEVLINNTRSGTLAKIRPGDEIRTGIGGVARIAFANRADVTLLPGTSLRVSAIQTGEIPVIRMEQTSGYAYHHVVPGKARYSVKANTFETEVKGTEFTVDLEHGDGAVKLFHGKVIIYGSSAATGLDAGNIAQITGGKATLRKLSADELAYAAHFKTLSASAELHQLLLGEKVPWSLADIRRKYRKISVIYTNRGVKYTGGFHTEADQLWVQTEKNKIVVPAADVTKILPYETQR